MGATVKKTPERKCVGCNEKKPKNELIRIVRCAQTGNIEIDRTGKKNGRGAYLCKDIRCLRRVRKSKRIDHTLECTIPDTVWDAMESELLGHEEP
jgi:predicted RNA-binding protein YlxR (DUF448 family)